MKVNIGKYPKGNRERKIKVQIDSWDTWSLDHTLAYIIHPALVQIKEQSLGHPCGIAPSPENAPDYQPAKMNHSCDNCTCEKEWNGILDKMIWSFKQVMDDDILSFSPEEYREYNKKVQEGLELFGKYYQNLWT